MLRLSRGVLPMALLIGFIFLCPTFPASASPGASAPLPHGTYGSLSVGPAPTPGPTTWALIPYGEAALARVPGAVAVGTPPGVPQSVLLTLPYSNASELSRFLTALSEPSSPLYHQYMDTAEFDAAFAPPASEYSAVLSYVTGHGVVKATTFSDRDTIEFEATPALIDALFHTQEVEYRVGGTTYDAPSTPPEFPTGLSGDISNVEGLSTSPLLDAHVAGAGATAIAESGPQVPHLVAGGYQAPVNYQGSQMEYAPDFQVGYDELSLFAEYGYPTSAVVATILWSGEYTGGAKSTPNGTLTTDQLVGDVVPWDVKGFWEATLPAGQPMPKFQAVPFGGAPGAGGLASYDSIGAVFENTLDLEMVGSLAPGSSIYNVYGPSNSFANLDQAFASALSPSGLGAPGLANVSVISNSWYGQDFNDTSWYQDLEQAQARGITVLACTGDSGNDPASSKYFGSDPSYPSTEAFNAFGDTGVGGSTDTLNPTTLVLNGLTTWYISPKDTGDGGPAGTEGGISTVFPEPSWQKHSLANEVIHGAGRGVPDLSGIANNTLITITTSGYQYKATNATNGGAFEWAWGTSISTPMTAGIIAVVNTVLNRSGEPWAGYLNPDLYVLGTWQYLPVNSSGNTGFYSDDGFDSLIPTTVYTDVTSGCNFQYCAAVGYDLVTGWGNLDAYNYTMYILQAHSAGIPGRLQAVEDYLNISALTPTPHGGSYTASVQQNFFVANSLGAPIYWVQNVIYMTKETSSTYSITDTGWLVYPFYGIYYDQASYEYNFPGSQTWTVGQPFDVYTTLLQGTGFNTQSINFNVGTGNLVSLPAPGGAYILGNRSQSYNWKGVTEWNGPFPDNADPGGLAVEMGLVGGPSGGNTTYGSPTTGSIDAFLQPFGTTYWAPAQSGVVWPSIDQTGEDAYGQQWTATSANDWTLGTSTGSAEQGIDSYEGVPYYVDCTETGLPSGSEWFVNLSDGLSYHSTHASFSFEAPNGTFPYTVAAGPSGWTPTPGSGTLTLSGGGSLSVAFAPTPMAAGSVLLNRTQCELSCGIALNATFTGGAGPFTATINWGDGSPVQLVYHQGRPAFATHAYTTTGTFTVSVSVNDSYAQTITEPSPGAITVAPLLQVQDVLPSAWSSGPPANETFTYSIAAGTGSGSLVGYLWNFADGNTSTASTAPYQIYERPGTYTITLRVTDSWGYSAGGSVTITVFGAGTALSLSKGWNLIALPAIDNDYTLYEVSVSVGPTFVSEEDGTTGVSFAHGGSTGNSPFSPGDALWLDVTAASTLTLFGNSTASLAGISFTAGSWSEVGWSVSSSVRASALSTYLGAPAGLEMVSVWNAPTQGWVTFVYGFDSPGGPYDATITPGQGVYLWTSGSGSFTE